MTSTTTEPASAAACFTKNVFQAAPVQVSRSILLNHGGRARSLIVNSGCANAVTGKQGLEDAWSMSRKTDEALNGEANGTLVMSTGVIGQNLKMHKILETLPRLPESLSDTYDGWSRAAQAFMTTDTFPKLRTRSVRIGGQEVRFAGIDKGAGMIHPRMGPPGPPHATLLGLIATDANIAPPVLQSALNYAIDRSFNSISVDGDMSTNDTVIAFANGASGAHAINSESSADFQAFQGELTDFATELASLVVRDGEGATKFVKIAVNVGTSTLDYLLAETSRQGTPTYSDAHHIASVIARSPLVKTALYGEDANWGRVLCAVGYSSPGFSIDPTKVSMSIKPSDGSETLRLLVNGEPQPFEETRAKQILKLDDIELVVDLQQGNESAA